MNVIFGDFTREKMVMMIMICNVMYVMQHKYLLKEENLMIILQEGKWGKENNFFGDKFLYKRGDCP